jgi:hypothetical protein
MMEEYSITNTTKSSIKTAIIYRNFCKNTELMNGWHLECNDDYELHNYINLHFNIELQNCLKPTDLTNLSFFQNDSYDLQMHWIEIDGLCGIVDCIGIDFYNWWELGYVESKIVINKGIILLEIQANFYFQGFFFYEYSENEVLDFIKTKLQLKNYSLIWEVYDTKNMLNRCLVKSK